MTLDLRLHDVDILEKFLKDWVLNKKYIVLYLMKTFCLYNVSNHRNFYQNQLINE